jgi:hypothetical protein
MNRLLSTLAAVGVAAALGLLAAPARAGSCDGCAGCGNGCGDGCAGGGCGLGGHGGCGLHGWGKCCWPQHTVWDCDFLAICCGCCNLYYSCNGACLTPYHPVVWPDSPVLAAADVRARLDRLGIPLVPPDTVYLGKVPGKTGEKLPPPREGEPKKGGEDRPEDTKPESNG